MVLNVCEIVAPVPAVAPVTPVSTTVQEKMAPDTLLDKAIEEVAPEQNVWVGGTAVTTTGGLTEIDTIGFFDEK